MTSSCSAVCRAPAAGATFLYGVSSIAVLQLVEPMLLAVCADGGAVHLFLHSIPFVYQQHAWGWCVMPPLCSNCVGQSNACMHACMHARAARYGVSYSSHMPHHVTQSTADGVDAMA
jgi:hypothetical protein